MLNPKYLISYRSQGSIDWVGIIIKATNLILIAAGFIAAIALCSGFIWMVMPI